MTGEIVRRRSRQAVSRPRVVQFSLTEEEFEEVSQAAERSGLARGAFAAEAALASARGAPTRAWSPLREALVEVIAAAGLGDCKFKGVTPGTKETPVTDVTTTVQGQEPVDLSAADEQVLRELTERARACGLRLTGEGGLLGKLTKMVVEGALEGELDDHPGYGKHDPAGRDGGNSRNGHRPRTVLTEAGPVELSVPRDRDPASSRESSLKGSGG